MEVMEARYMVLEVAEARNVVLEEMETRYMVLEVVEARNVVLEEMEASLLLELSVSGAEKRMH